MKKIIIVLLLICVAANTCAFANKNTENNSYRSDAIEKVLAFGIMQGYTNGTFGESEPVKRCEAATVVSQMINLTENNISDTFKDVLFSHWAKGYIEAAASAQIVSGVGNGFFEPDSEITKYQAAIILLNAMGYGKIADINNSGVYKKYISELKLYSGIFKSEDEAITRAEFAQMICNVLDKPLVMTNPSTGTQTYEVNKDCTILSEYLNIYETEGQITANEYTGLSSKKGVSDAMVQIGDETYYTGKTSAWENIGKRLKVFYKDSGDGNKVIVYYTVCDRKTITIHAKDIVSFENNVLTYENAGSKKICSEKISETADVIFNGKYKALKKDDFFPLSGSIELYDYNEDTLADVIYINSYATYVVGAINKEKHRIIDKYGKPPIEFDEKDFVNAKLDGKKIETDDIAVGDIISVAADDVYYDNGCPLATDKAKMYDIRVSRDKIKGKIETIDNDSVTIGGIDYSVSNALNYETARGKAAEMALGLDGIFNIDAFGELFTYESDSTLPVDGNYGYAVEAAKVRKNGREGVALRIFDFKLQDIEVMDCAKRVEIDGEIYRNADDVYNALLRQYDGISTSEFAARLIVYKTDDGLINFIDTDYISHAESSKTSLVFNENQDTRMYANGVFGGDIAIDNKSIVLSVPRTRASAKPLQTTPGNLRQFICNKNQEEYIYFRSPSFAANSTKYIVESYNAKDNGQAALVIYYYIPSSNTSIIGEDSSQTMIVDKVSGAVIGGEDGFEIRGFCGDKSLTLFLKSSDSVVADIKTEADGTVNTAKISPFSLKQGDVVKYSNLMQNSNITLRIERVYSVDENTMYSEKHYTQENKNSTLTRIEYFNAFNVAYGNVTDCDDGIIKIDFGTNSKVYNISAVTVNICSREDKKIATADCSSVTQDMQAVVISANGTVKAIYVYD